MAITDVLFYMAVLGTLFFLVDIYYFQRYLYRCGWKVCILHYTHHIMASFAFIGWIFVPFKLFILIILGIAIGWFIFDGCFWTNYCEKLCELPKKSLSVHNPINIVYDKFKGFKPHPFVTEKNKVEK